jgi:hypothetical protein
MHKKEGRTQVSVVLAPFGNEVWLSSSPYKPRCSLSAHALGQSGYMVPTEQLIFKLSLHWQSLTQKRQQYKAVKPRLIQTSQTGGQWYSDTSHFSIPWPSPSCLGQLGRSRTNRNDPICVTPL